jgi:hypothetical protein
VTATAVHTTSISLELGCCPQADSEFGGLYLQLSRGGYDRCSVLELPATVEEWRNAHRTARKRASRSERLGYRFAVIERDKFADDIYRINTSLQERQGRPMSNGYMTRQSYAPLPDYPCPRHRITTYGVLRHDRLYAYCWLYRAGDLALVSSILGHGDALRDDVMYLLVQGVINGETGQDGRGYLLYNRWDSGTDGLRFFKARCGFTEQRVEWMP